MDSSMHGHEISQLVREGRIVSMHYKEKIEQCDLTTPGAGPYIIKCLTLCASPNDRESTILVFVVSVHSASLPSTLFNIK